MIGTGYACAVGNRIRELRDQRSQVNPGSRAYTLAAIATRLGVTESAVWRWERGLAKPRKSHARALARELGVSVDQLELNAPEPTDAR